MGYRELLASGSAFLVLMFLIKIYGVARYSLTTTTGLLAASPVQVGLGTVTIYAYYVMPALALGTIWVGVRYRRGIQWSVWPVIVIVATLTALASPFHYLLTELGVVAVAVVAELILWRFVRSAGSDRSALAGLRGTLVVYFAIGLLAYQFLVSLDAPWVSAQVFRLDAPAVVATQRMTVHEGVLDVGSERVFVGYPISEEAGWLTVLHAETRYLMRFPVDAVQDRLTCHNEADQLHGGRPLLAVLEREPYDSPNINCELVREYLARQP